MTQASQVTVLGAGLWGTTVASLAAANTSTVLWARDADLATEIDIEHRDSRYLSELELHPDPRATASLQDAVEAANVLVMGVPSAGMGATLGAAAAFVRPWVPVINLAKGLEKGSRKRPSEVIEDRRGLLGHPAGVLAGPNLAREVLAGYAAAAVIAMPDEQIAHPLQPLFSRRVFRVYTSTDVLGCELGDVLKNVIAIPAGMAEGLGVGDDTRASGDHPRAGQGDAARSGDGCRCEHVCRPHRARRSDGQGMSPFEPQPPGGRAGRAGPEPRGAHRKHDDGRRGGKQRQPGDRARPGSNPIAVEVDAVVNHSCSAAEAFRGLRQVQARPSDTPTDVMESSKNGF